MKLTDGEWAALLLAGANEFGEEALMRIAVDTLGQEKTAALQRRERIAVSKEETRRIVRALYDLVPGKTREEKTQAAIDFGRRVFIDDKRFQEVLDYVLEKIAEHEQKGGTIDDMPPPPPEPEKPDRSDLTGQEEPGLRVKNVSESDKKLVHLLPAAFTDRTDRILRMYRNGQLVAASNRAHSGRPQPNGDREHYRWQKPGSQFEAPYTLVTRVDDSYEIAWDVPVRGRDYPHRGQPLKGYLTGGGVAGNPVEPTPAPGGRVLTWTPFANHVDVEIPIAIWQISLATTTPAVHHKQGLWGPQKTGARTFRFPLGGEELRRRALALDPQGRGAVVVVCNTTEQQPDGWTAASWLIPDPRQAWNGSAQ